MAETLGARKGLVYDGDGAFADEILALTEGKGVDCIYDGVGKTTFLAGFKCLRIRGSMVLFGMASGAPDPFSPQDLIAGSWNVTRPTLWHFIADRASFEQRAEEVFGWLQDDIVAVQPPLVIPLKDARRAHIMLEGRETTGVSESRLILKHPCAR